MGSHLDRTGHMDLHGDPTDRDGSRKPGIIWKTKIGAFYGALDMVSGNGSLLWSAVSMVLNQVKKPDYKKNYVLVKTLQSAAFVSVFLAAAVVSRDILDFWLMLPAFVCCFAGDVILAFIIRSKKRLFVGTCHIFNGASVLYPVAGPDAAAGSCRYGVSGHSGDRDFAVTGMGSFHTGRLRPCILVYTFLLHTCLQKHAYCSEYPKRAPYGLCCGKPSVYGFGYFHSVSLFL